MLLRNETVMAIALWFCCCLSFRVPSSGDLKTQSVWEREGTLLDHHFLLYPYILNRWGLGEGVDVDETDFRPFFFCLMQL